MGLERADQVLRRRVLTLQQVCRSSLKGLGISLQAWRQKKNASFFASLLMSLCIIIISNRCFLASLDKNTDCDASNKNKIIAH